MLFYFSSVTGISVDGQYVNNPFTKAFKKKFGFSSPSDYHLPVIWDACHLLNCAVTDVKNGKNGFKRSLFMERFIERSNLFPHYFCRGKGHALLKAVAKDHKLPLSIPQAYAHQR